MWIDIPLVPKLRLGPRAVTVIDLDTLAAFLHKPRRMIGAGMPIATALLGCGLRVVHDMFGRKLILLVPFLAFSCVSTPAQPDVDMRFMTEGRDKSDNPQGDKSREMPDPSRAAFRRLEFGMSFGLVRAILGGDPTRDEIKDGPRGGRSCSWSFEGGSYANIDFDAKDRI